MNNYKTYNSLLSTGQSNSHTYIMLILMSQSDSSPQNLRRFTWPRTRLAMSLHNLATGGEGCDNYAKEIILLFHSFLQVSMAVSKSEQNLARLDILEKDKLLQTRDIFFG